VIAARSPGSRWEQGGVIDHGDADIDPLGKVLGPSLYLVRSSGIHQLRDDLLRHDDSAVKAVQHVQRSDEREIVQGELLAMTTVIASSQERRRYPSGRLPG
jgi:hypothetical protein